MAQAMGIRDWECGTHKPAGGENCHDKDRKPESETKGKGEEVETNPTELTCFLSITYNTEGRNKPKGDISNFFSSLERN